MNTGLFKVAGTFLCLIFVFLSEAGAATNLLYYIGGSGDPSASTSSFDPDIEKLGKFVHGSNWQPTVLFDGNRSDTKKIMMRGLGDFGESFTTKGFTKTVENLEKQLAAKSILEGSQVLFVIDSHGKSARKKELTHPVEAENHELVSLDRLKILRDKMKKAGVKFAIVDTSCYSGLTQSLGDADTCVISTTTKGMPSVNIGAINFYDHLKPGKSLEENFLLARINDISPEFPQISSEAGKKLERILRPLAPKTYWTDEEIVSTAILDAYFRSVSCRSEQENDKSLTSLIASLQQLVDSGKLLTDGTSSGVLGFLKQLPSKILGQEENFDLSQRLERMQSAIADYNKKISAARQAFVDKEKLAHLSLHIGNKAYSYEELYGLRKNSSDLELQQEVREAELDDPDVSKAQKKESAKQLREIAELKASLNVLDGDPEFRNFSRNREVYRKTFLSLTEDAFEISKMERGFYDALYSAYQKQDKGPNPCATFLL